MDSAPPLDLWLPHLLAAWRQGPGPEDGFTPPEADAVASGVKELSRGLTGDRSLVGQRYLARGDLLGAYLLYYWPVSFAQTLYALRQGRVPSQGRALDLGSGPGPGAFALFAAGWTSVTAADRSPEALALAKTLGARTGHRLETLTWDAETSAPPAGPWNLVVIGHVLNELASGAPDRIERRWTFLQEVAKTLAPGGLLLVLEPASHGPNADALALRDRAAGAGGGISGPCFFHGPCPARAAGAACHDVLRWKVPHLVAQTARRAQIDKREVPFTWFVFHPESQPVLDPSVIRVVSEPMLNKAGRRRVVACGPQGRFSLSAPGAYRSPAWIHVHRGVALRVTHPELREGGWGLGPSTKLSPG